MEEFMLDNGNKIKCTGMVNSSGQTGEPTVVSMWMTKNKVKECLNGVNKKNIVNLIILADGSKYIGEWDKGK